MGSLDEIENYLNKAEGISFEKDGDNIVLIVWFDDKLFKEFSELNGYTKLVEFFDQSEVVLVIKEKIFDGKDELFYRTSLVDKGTADVVNLNSVLWGPDTLKDFKETVKVDTKINLVIALIDRVQSKFIPHPASGTHNPIILDGYSYEKTPWDKDSDMSISE